MNKSIYTLAFVLIVLCILSVEQCKAQNGPVISNLTYDSITQTGLIVFWITDSPADSKILWMAPDSNYQPLIFTDSLYFAAAVTNHVLQISNLQPAKIYKYRIMSQNTGGTTVDSGYFMTQSASSGKVDVYFNHSVDTTVSTGEKANGNQNFETLLINRIDSANYSIDITLWEFTYYTSVLTELIKAKDRGVKIRFIYTDNTPDSPLVDSLRNHDIPVLKRNYDTTHSMHNKFWIFDYRYNSNANSKYLWTGSTNVSHAQFKEDRNNVIVIQDESLCATYTREFEEMWGSHTDLPDASRAKFGAEKVNNVPHILNVAGTRMEVWFSPSDSVTSYVCNLIQTKTTKSLFFCMYKFTLSNFEDALHTVFRQGISISGVFDSSNSVDQGCAYLRMKGANVPNAWDPPADVFIDTIDGLLHHKYFITDANSSAGNKITVTGSFNWEPDASLKNDENSLIVFNARVNNLYFQEFYKRYRESGGTTIGMQNINTKALNNFQLGQNIPNPFNTVTKIEFEMPQAGIVKLIVFDAFGREIITLVNEKRSPGTYDANWNASQYPGGVYYYRLTVDGFSETKKMILVK
jgi:phosphatidylserine/phosphatidylglycerophosphate/cardiolipin synthase-like enzyme